MDKRKLRRSGTLQGAEKVHSLIKRAMGRAIKKNVSLLIAVPQYLATIPPIEFETLIEHMHNLDLSEPLIKDINNEIEARYLLK